MNAAVKLKEAERQEIEAKIREFLEAGGQIEVLPPYQQSDGFRFDYWVLGRSAQSLGEIYGESN